jgi:hypothetical protein
LLAFGKNENHVFFAKYILTWSQNLEEIVQLTVLISQGLCKHFWSYSLFTEMTLVIVNEAYNSSQSNSYYKKFKFDEPLPKMIASLFKQFVKSFNTENEALDYVVEILSHKFRDLAIPGFKSTNELGARAILDSEDFLYYLLVKDMSTGEQFL